MHSSWKSGGGGGSLGFWPNSFKGVLGFVRKSGGPLFSFFFRVLLHCPHLKIAFTYKLTINLVLQRATHIAGPLLAHWQDEGFIWESGQAVL
jgi:hypothetical protein